MALRDLENQAPRLGRSTAEEDEALARVLWGMRGGREAFQRYAASLAVGPVEGEEVARRRAGTDDGVTGQISATALVSMLDRQE